MNCPGSVVLSEGMPEKSSAFAEEGTQAHALAEQLLRGPRANFSYALKEMLDHVLVYIDYVESLAWTDADVVHVEQRVHVNEDVYGTADAVVWQPEARHLHVVDLKYGAGVPVEVHDNLQLRIYALAALLTFKYPAQQVTATIVQPRCPHSAGPVRSVTFDVVDLLDFHAELADAVERVYWAHVDDTKGHGVEGHLKPTEKGCRWCLAAPKCPAIKSKAQAMAKTVFSPGLPYDPLDLARTLDFLPIIEGWCSNVREFCYAEAEKGHAIPDYKLVEKRPTRKWIGEESVIAEALAKAGVAEDEIFDRKLVTPAAAEKLLPKEQRVLLDAITVKQSSGHTLVHDSDKRPAIRVDAKEAFK